MLGQALSGGKSKDERVSMGNLFPAFSSKSYIGADCNITEEVTVYKRY